MSEIETNAIEKQIFTISGSNTLSILEHLHIETGLAKHELKQYALKGAVWLAHTRSNGQHSKPERIRRLKKVLKANQTVHFNFNAELLNQVVPAPILIKDFQQYSVWLKPRGMLSQGSKWADHTALYRWVEMHHVSDDTPNGSHRYCWIVHRLDRATCGLMLLAHNKKMASTLSHMFEKHQIHKTYQAIVWGKPNSLQFTIDENIDDKSAVSHVKVIKSILLKTGQTLSQLEIKIDTGRKHQIRRHLSSLKLPIVGDRLYGDLNQDDYFDKRPNLQLTAYQLLFQCPISNTDNHFELTKNQLDLLNLSHIEDE